MGEARQFYIYSGEHNAYWRAECSGYTTSIDHIGRYTLNEAKQVTDHCGPEKQIKIGLISKLRAASVEDET